MKRFLAGVLSVLFTASIMVAPADTVKAAGLEVSDSSKAGARMVLSVPKGGAFYYGEIDGWSNIALPYEWTAGMQQNATESWLPYEEAQYGEFNEFRKMKAGYGYVEVGLNVDPSFFNMEKVSSEINAWGEKGSYSDPTFNWLSYTPADCGEDGRVNFAVYNRVVGDEYDNISIKVYGPTTDDLQGKTSDIVIPAEWSATGADYTLCTIDWSYGFYTNLSTEGGSDPMAITRSPENWYAEASPEAKSAYDSYVAATASGSESDYIAFAQAHGAGDVAGMPVHTVVDVTPYGVTPEQLTAGVALTFRADGVTAGADIVVLHLKANGEWEVLSDAVAVADNKIRATFTSFSPVFYGVVTRDAAADEAHNHNFGTLVAEPTETTWGYTTYYCACGYEYHDNYVAPLSGAAEAPKVTSPKTGENALPFVMGAAVVAALGGAVVIARRKYTA